MDGQKSTYITKNLIQEYVPDKLILSTCSIQVVESGIHGGKEVFLKKKIKMLFEHSLLVYMLLSITKNILD